MKSKIQKSQGLVFSLYSIVRKTYFVELVLDGSSYSHQNWHRSSTDNGGKKLWNSSRFVQAFSNNSNEFAEKDAKMDLRLYLRKGLTD